MDSVLSLLSNCTVRVVNERTARVVEEHPDLTEIEAYRLARQLAEGLARDYGNDVVHARREFPFKPDMQAAYDPYRVEVLQRDQDNLPNWRGSRSVIDGFITAYGRCAY